MTALRGEPARTRTWIPGEAGLWVFVFVDLFVFGSYFGVFIFEHGKDKHLFNQSSHALSPTHGAISTILLLTGSLFVALGVRDVRAGNGPVARRLFLWAAVCGAGFAVNKGFEWASVLHHHNPQDNTFFQLYFLLTGLHLLHVCVATTVVLIMRARTPATAGLPATRRMRFVENGASYWHFVDVVWLVLFALFYLVR